MLDKLALDSTNRTNYELIAETLGLKYNADDDILYIGDNNKIGIRLYFSDSYPSIRMIYRDSEDNIKEGSQRNRVNYNETLFGVYYKKSKYGIAFGFNSGIETICCIITKCIDLDTKEEKYLYLIMSGAVYDALTEDNDFYSDSTTFHVYASEKAISLAPVVLKDRNKYCEHVYHIIAGPTKDKCGELILGEKEFIMSDNNNLTFVLEI
jgi:hypothetical protein